MHIVYKYKIHLYPSQVVNHKQLCEQFQLMYKFVIRIHICIFWWSFSYGEILGEILYQLFLFWEMLKILLGRKNAMILRVCGLGSAGLIAGLDDLTVLFQPKWFYDFVFRPEGPGSACNCSLKILLFLIGRQEWSSCLEPGISVSHSCGSLWWHSELTLLMFLVFGGVFFGKACTVYCIWL